MQVLPFVICELTLLNKVVFETRVGGVRPRAAGIKRESCDSLGHNKDGGRSDEPLQTFFIFPVFRLQFLLQPVYRSTSLSEEGKAILTNISCKERKRPEVTLFLKTEIVHI